MTNKTIHPATFVYMTDTEQLDLIFEQLRTIFDSSLQFKQYTKHNNMRALTTVSIDFTITTQDKDTLEITYYAEYNILSIKNIRRKGLQKLFNYNEFKNIEDSLTKAIKTYSLTDLFDMKSKPFATKIKPENGTDLSFGLILGNNHLTINLNKNTSYYNADFKFNSRNVKIKINLTDNTDKINLQYYKTIKKTVKGEITTETGQCMSLNKTSFKAFEHCFYDLYLKSEYNIPRKTKDALKVIEMLVI